MSLLEHLQQPISQRELAAVLGVTEGRVSQWADAGLLPAGAPAASWILLVVGRLREQAAGRHSDGPLDLTQERAALAREQRMGIEIKNRVLRGEYAPVTLLAEVLATASQAVSERMDHIRGLLRRVCPDLPEAALDQVMTAIASARAEWVRGTAQLVRAKVAEAGADSDDDEPPVDLSDDSTAIAAAA